MSEAGPIFQKTSTSPLYRAGNSETFSSGKLPGNTAEVTAPLGEQLLFLVPGSPTPQFTLLHPLSLPETSEQSSLARLPLLVINISFFYSSPTFR